VKETLEGKGRQFGSPGAKRKQLLIQERLHLLFNAGELEQNILSHYLLVSAPHREQWLQQLDLLDDDFMDFNMLPSRLEKFPPGWVVFADQGFQGMAQYYRFLNSQIAPLFLDGRDQFDVSEVMEDCIKCNK
jgi:hypothetical protein